jgi:hypothetical protein
MSTTGGDTFNQLEPTMTPDACDQQPDAAVPDTVGSNEAAQVCSMLLTAT